MTASDPSSSSIAVENCQNIKADAAGNLYLQAHLNQIYQFDNEGKFLKVLGGGTNLRVTDGSELLNSLALDSHGNIYASTPGNPCFICRFDPDWKTVTQRQGLFNAIEGWGQQPILAIDKKDRLWVGVTGKMSAKMKKAHLRPCVLRLDPDYFDSNDRAVTTHGTLLQGLHLEIDCKMPFHIAYDQAPITVALVARASVRRLRHVDIHWVVYDVFKKEVASGDFPLPLVDGAEARQEVTFTPPGFGWYAVVFEARQSGNFLTALGEQIGVTPRYTGMVSLNAAESKGGIADPARDAFSGLMLERVNTTGKIERLEHDVEAVRQIRDNSARPARERQGLRCRDRSLHRDAPQGEGAILGDHQRARSLHVPREVRENPQRNARRHQGGRSRRQDPRAGRLRHQAPLARSLLSPRGKGLHRHPHGPRLRGEPVDQPGTLVLEARRSAEADGPVRRRRPADLADRTRHRRHPLQEPRRRRPAVRILLHRDLLETLGIPSEHNMHFYLIEHGFLSVPSYMWSKSGPQPVALATRTRYAMIEGLRYAGTLDFGPSGNKMFMGLHYTGAAGDTITLRNLGTLDRKLELSVKGGDAVSLVDVFGNVTKIPVRDGKVTLTLTMLPSYLRLAKGQVVTPPRFDFGQNYANQATFRYSAPHDGNIERFEQRHSRNAAPGQSASKSVVRRSRDGTTDARDGVPAAGRVNRLLIFSTRSDNPFFVPCSTMTCNITTAPPGRRSIKAGPRPRFNPARSF